MRGPGADEGLGRFRSEYEKLLRALRTTQDGERRLVRKVQDLNAEIVNGRRGEPPIKAPILYPRELPPQHF